MSVVMAERMGGGGDGGVGRRRGQEGFIGVLAHGFGRVGSAPLPKQWEIDHAGAVLTRGFHKRKEERNGCGYYAPDLCEPKCEE